MKKIFLWMTFFMLVSMSGQELNTNVVTIDLSKSTSDAVKSTEKGKRLNVRSRDFLKFKIVNGNPFKYDYVLSKQLINFFENKDDNPLAKIEKLLKENPTKDNTSSKEIEANKDTIKVLTSEKENIQNSYKRTNDKRGFILKNNFNDSLTIRLSEIESKLDDLSRYSPLAVESFQIVNKDKTKSIYDVIKNKNDDENMILNGYREIKIDLESFLPKLSKFVISYKSSDSLDIVKFIEERDTLYSMYNKITDNYFRVRRDSEKLSSSLEKFKNINNDIKESILSITTDFKEMFSIKNDVSLIPIEFNGKNIDVIQIGLKKYDKKNPIPIEECTYNVWIKGGFKIDISGGVFISSLVNKEYYIQDKIGSTTGEKVILERQKGNFDFGFGSTINISRRSAGWLNPTLNVGAIFTTNQQFQLITGLGAILGKEERVIFSSGLSMGRISKIAENLKADGETAYNLGAGAVPTSTIFDFGYYFGVTYNFSPTKKQTNSDNGK